MTDKELLEAVQDLLDKRSDGAFIDDYTCCSAIAEAVEEWRWDTYA